MRGMIAWLVTGILVVAGASVARGSAQTDPPTPLQIATLTAANPTKDDQFGYSVDVAGDTIVVGVPFAGMGGDKRGAAHVFTANRDGTVTQTAILNSPEPANEEYFGASVAMSADTIVIGAPGATSNRGAVYLYEKPASGWGDATKTATLTASNSAEAAWFGYSVGISGDTVVAGAIGHDRWRGAGYVFSKPSGGWSTATETAILTASNAADDDRFGYSVDVSGDTIILGAPGAKNSQGAAYVFGKPSGGWSTATETVMLIRPVPVVEDWFGLSVGVSGDTIVVGAPGTSDKRGSGHVFKKPPGGWATVTETATLTASNAADGAQLGMSVKISEDRILIGAPYAGSGGKDRGAAYVFSKSLATETAILTASNPVDDDSFGWSVGMSADTIVVGAVGVVKFQGTAYVYGAPGISVAPGSWDFGNVRKGKESSRTPVTVTNTGLAPLVVSEIGLSGANPRQFSIASQTCTGTPIAAGSTCTVDVRFSPTRFGVKSASLTLASSATASPQVVDLTGVGTGKKKQTLTPKPPKRLKRVGTTVITRPKARTNAQQRVRTTVRGGPMKASATGQVRYFSVLRAKSGKVAIRTYGRKDLKITVTQRAPATSGYLRFKRDTVYVNGERQ